jgi:chromosomal replication initiation ATPase DnaA
MNADGKTTVDSFIDGIILLSKNVSDSDYYTLDSDFLFKGDYKCLKKAVAYARETVDKVIKKQPLPINPLIFVGEVNSCKNRLLFAMWNSLQKEKLNKGEGEPVVFYLQIASDHDPMNALYDGFSDMEKKEVFVKMTEIIKGTDMIFVDEIQYLEGKHKTLNLMLETTKFMESINKPIVMTSQKIDIDKSKLVPELAERLRNFEYIKIPLPDAEDRIKMLEDFLKKESLSLENPSLTVAWAKNTEKYPLKCLLNKLSRLACEAENGVVTEKTMEQIFETEDFAEKILDVISERFKIDIKTMVNEDRKFAYERSLAMYFIKGANRDMDFDEVGKKLGRSGNTARMAFDGIERALNGGKDFFNKTRPAQIIADVEEIRRLLQPS